MRYYSDKTHQFYPTERDCLNAEAAYEAAEYQRRQEEKKKAEVKKAKLNEIKYAQKRADEANEALRKLKADFYKEYPGDTELIKDAADEWLDLLNQLFKAEI